MPKHLFSRFPQEVVEVVIEAAIAHTRQNRPETHGVLLVERACAYAGHSFQLVVDWAGAAAGVAGAITPPGYFEQFALPHIIAAMNSET